VAEGRAVTNSDAKADPTEPGKPRPKRDGSRCIIIGRREDRSPDERAKENDTAAAVAAK
jgi:hypothetical protein